MIGEWYETLEPGIREIVRFLRDNGINTECSCEHKKYVQCQHNHDGFIYYLDKLLFHAGFRNYTIDIHIIREDGYLRHFININFKELAIEDPEFCCIDLNRYRIKILKSEK